MRRLTTILTVAIGTTAIHAAPPTAEDWWTAMGRYTGDHMLKDGESGEVVGAFEVEWGVPFERINYRFHSIGEGPASMSTGFCGWDAALGKVRFLEVETGPDGIVTTMGTLADVDGAVDRAFTQKINHFLQGLQAAQMTRLDLGRAGQLLLQGGHDFHPLDRVNPQIRIQAHVKVQHLGRITRFLGDDFQQRRGNAPLGD